MARNNNKKTAFIAFAMLSTLTLSHAQTASAGAPTGASSAISFLGDSVRTYFPQSLAVATSMSRLTVDLARAVNTRSMGVAGQGETGPVVQVSIQSAGMTGKVPAGNRSGPAAAAFDTVAVPFKRLAALKKLAPSLEEMDKGTAIACVGKACAPAVAAVRLAGAGSSEMSLRDRLNAVNAAVNKAITYRSDMETRGVADHWATPSETLARGEGDCEDFAILKMAALRAQGIDPATMSIVALFDQKRRLYHAVLSVEVSGRHFILDNVRNQVLQDSQIPEYVALYSIRDGKGFLHGSQRQKQIASAITSMEKIAPGAGVN